MKANNEIKKEIFSYFIDELFLNLEELYILGSGKDFTDFFKNIKKSKLSVTNIETAMRQSIYDSFFFCKNREKEFDDFCKKYQEDDNFMIFKNMLKLRLGEMYEEYINNNNKIFDNFKLDNHLNKINDENLKNKYRDLALTLVVKKNK